MKAAVSWWSCTTLPLDLLQWNRLFELLESKFKVTFVVIWTSSPVRHSVARRGKTGNGKKNTLTTMPTVDLRQENMTASLELIRHDKRPWWNVKVPSCSCEHREGIQGKLPLHPFLTSALDARCRQLHAPAAFHTREGTHGTQRTGDWTSYMVKERALK